MTRITDERLAELAEDLEEHVPNGEDYGDTLAALRELQQWRQLASKFMLQSQSEVSP